MKIVSQRVKGTAIRFVGSARRYRNHYRDRY